MRAAIVAIVVGGCSFDPSLADDDTPGEDTKTITHDSAEDFAGPIALVDAVIDPAGRIEPNAYVTGGLHARAYAGKLVTADSTFATLDTAIAAVTPLGRGYGFVPDDYASTRPGGLSIVTSNDFSIYFDGEIHLSQGRPTFSIDADDAGILEVTVDGTPHFLLDATGGAKQLDVDVPADGWYPIRLALGEGSGNAKFVLRVNGVLDRFALRSRVTDERGLMAHLYDPGHVEFRNTAGVDGFDGAYGQVSPPNDFAPTTTSGNYDFRVVGQILIDVAGEWEFELAPDAKSTARLWIDEEHVASAWADGVTDTHTNTAKLELAAGWHDIFLDFRALQISPKNGVLDPHDVSIQVRARPPGGASEPIPTSKLRPVVSSGLVTAKLESNKALTTDGQTIVPLQFPLATTLIHSVDAGYALTAGARAAYKVELDTGNGALFDVPPATGLDQFGLLFDEISLRGAPSPTAWAMKFTDNSIDLVNGVAGLVFVDIVTRGGPATPFSPAIGYTSKPIATPGAIRLGAVRVTGAFDDAEVVVEVRAAASEAALEDATFVEVASGGVPEIAAGEFIQYRIGAKSDGWQFPVIDTVALDYIVAE